MRACCCCWTLQPRCNVQLWMALKAASTTSLCRTSSTVGRMLPKAGIRRGGPPSSRRCSRQGADPKVKGDGPTGRPR